MSIDQGKYICAYTDFGVKRLFGSELNKDILISFLNSFLNLKDKIVDLSYLSLEQLGDLVTDREAIFDVYCKTSDDAYIIVEMQNAAQNYFKDRIIFYSSFATRNQAPKGVLDYQLKAVYTIGILNYVLEKDSESYRHEVVLYDKVTKCQFYDKLAYYYFELPKFTKTEDELETIQDKWMYAIKNLSALNDKPVALKEQVFTRLFRIAEIAKFSEKEKFAYQGSLKKMWDNSAVLEKSYTDGRSDGKAEGKVEGKTEERLSIAKNLKEIGISPKDIFKATGLKEGEY